MHEPTTDHPYLFLVRPAPEILLKSSGTRRRFEARLRDNLRGALARAGIGHRLDMEGGRILLRAGGSPDTAEVCARVFGVASVAPVDRVVTGGPDAFAAAALELYADIIGGRTYAVRVKSMGRRLYRSMDLERAIGGALNPHGRVDLERPDVTVRLEVHGDTALLHARRVEGPCGFPLGSQGRVAALVSGGFDSVVAAWFMMKRGAAVEFVLCNLAGSAYEAQVVAILKTLVDRWGGDMAGRLHVVDLGPAVDDLRARCDPEVWQIVLKRLMYRAGCAIARRARCDAVVTGEALGQVSSQTLSNLNSIDVAADRPVLRPLIGFEKRDIISLARHIGTADLSEKVPEYCALTRRRPATRSTIGRIDREEAKLDPALLRGALDRTRPIDLDAVGGGDDGLVVDRLPAAARLIGLQGDDAFDAWHPEGAERLNAGSLLGRMEQLARERPLVLYCAHGTQSAVLAEYLREAGFVAHSFRGGTRGLRRHLEGR